MSNGAFGFINLCDTGKITASSFSILTPPSILQDPHVARKWRGTNGDNEYLVCDLGALCTVDTVMLLGINGLVTGADKETNLTEAAVTRVRLSSVDSTGAAGNIYDSGFAAGRINAKYGNLIIAFTRPVSQARFVRIDLSETGLSYLQAGRLGAFARQQTRLNFSYGWSRGWVDRSRKTEGRGGQTYVDLDTKYRVVELTFDAIKESERWDLFEEMDRLNGESSDILFIPDQAAADLGRAAIWGLVQNLAPVVQPIGWLDNEPIYTKSYRISERL